jgi:Fur family ferric uptake transcriptional regulator
MTASHLIAPLEVDSVTAAESALRDRGLRVSTARRLVLEALFLADRPLSAEAIAAGVPDRVSRSDLASVYRNLETLEELGLIRHVHLGHGPGLYALARDADREYLVCEGCGQVDALPATDLDDVRQLMRDRHGFEASFRHFPIVGLCADCNAGVQHDNDHPCHHPGGTQ